MKYQNIRKGTFLSRPNRFIAWMELDGRREKVHVKNTGRCRELLWEGAEVWLEKSSNPQRSTAYDLVTVRKGDRLVNMDSTAPNRAAEEWLARGGLYPEVEQIRPECRYGNSRFDFFVRAAGREIWMEVKGVTLETENTALFPDAPSLRALKHVQELMEAKRSGYEAVLLFVVQMEGIERFRPNAETQPEFARLLAEARRAGVQVLARGCRVSSDGMEISYEIPVELEEEMEGIAPRLLTWYDGNRRILPWREEPDPYRVWISEIMLQQTRVEAVKPYFARFMEALPDIRSLAQVDDDRLLKLWEGLGYYNRARNLKKAAAMVMEQYEGRMPARRAELLSLPGIGSYTAGAVASISYGEAVPAVDGNVLRVIARYRADDRDMLNAGVRRSVEEDLERVIPRDRPGDFNQALMELGAVVCLPNGAPRCEECPLREDCAARRQGSQLNYPRKTARKKRSVEEKTILVLKDGEKAALRKRPEKGLLAGMYEFPSLEGHKTREEVLSFLKEKGLSPLWIRKLPDSTHIFTHKEWHMIGYVIRVDELETGGREWDELIFVETKQAEEDFPIPSAYAAYTKYLAKNGQKKEGERRNK